MLFACRLRDEPRGDGEAARFMPKTVGTYRLHVRDDAIYVCDPKVHPRGHQDSRGVGERRYKKLSLGRFVLYLRPYSDRTDTRDAAPGAGNFRVSDETESRVVVATVLVCAGVTICF